MTHLTVEAGAMLAAIEKAKALAAEGKVREAEGLLLRVRTKVREAPPEAMRELLRGLVERTKRERAPRGPRTLLPWLLLHSPVTIP